MDKENKTALRLACEQLAKIWTCPLENLDINMNCDNCKDDRVECWEKYFKQQSVMTDGWDLVKEIKQSCIEERLVPNYEEDNYEAGFNNAKDDIIDLIDERLQTKEINSENE